MDRLKNRSATISEQLQKAKTENRTADAEKLQADLNDLSEELDQTRDDINTAETRAKAAAEAEKRRADAFADLRNTISKLENSVQRATTDIECLTASQTRIDEAIYTLLIPETQKNNFKLWMSAMFAFMVFTVIVLFFTVALKDAPVRAAIFSNQTGIQFVTLFSLVIAIILFGITEILQAKELSALLGGISGYILGRVTTDRTAASTAAVSPQARTVIATSISFAAPNTIRSATGGFEIFSPSNRIRITGSAGNNGDYTVTTVSSQELMVAEQTLNAEPAGARITITML